MTPQLALEKLSNQVIHDLEKQLEIATTSADREYWMSRIDEVESYIDFLHSTIFEQHKVVLTA